MNQKQRGYAINRVNEIWREKKLAIENDNEKKELTTNEKKSLIKQGKVKFNMKLLERHMYVVDTFDFSSQEATIEKANKKIREKQQAMLCNLKKAIDEAKDAIMFLADKDDGKTIADILAKLENFQPK